MIGTQWEGLVVGSRVRCVSPESFMTGLARNLKNREGTISRFQQFSGAPIVEFPAVGRRKALRWVPPHRNDIEVIA